MSDDAGRGHGPGADGSDDEREWRFDPADLPRGEAGAEGADGDEADDGDDSDGNVAGEFVSEMPIEPGTPDLGSAVWVAVGAYVAVLALTRVFVDYQGYSTQDLLVLTGGTLLATLVFMGLFGLLTPDT